MAPPSEFQRSLDQAARRLGRAHASLERVQHLADSGDSERAFSAAFQFAEEVEKLALLARALPAYTGHPQAARLTEQLLVQTVPIEMGYTREGWFQLRIPALLPKKEHGSPSYLRDLLYPAMRRFFAGKVPHRYTDCVLVFRHIYDRARPERAYRDHDNIELNMVVDIVALYLLTDDAPLRCAHYYCSASGPQDCTDVYIIPRGSLSDWLAAAENGSLAGKPLLTAHP